VSILVEEQTHPHSVNVVLRFIGTLSTRGAAEDVFLQRGQLRFFRHHAEVVAFQIVVGDLFGDHVQPVATWRNFSHRDFRLLGSACPIVPFCRRTPVVRICLNHATPIMRKCLISFILESPGLDHVAFFDALTTAGAEMIMPSHWVIQSEQSAAELRDHFAALLSPNDQLLVAELGQDIAWGRKD
jgi:hypothetical protein